MDFNEFPRRLMMVKRTVANVPPGKLFIGGAEFVPPETR
jgi:hypothetical protein